MRTKVRKTYNYLIRILIIAATYGFIYRQVFTKKDLPEVFGSFSGQFGNTRFIELLLLVMFLMLVNWSTEALKWKYLIGKIERLNWFSAFKAVLTGVAVSAFTPNRVGDYFGRVFILEKANRIEGVFITILGSMSQLLVTFIAGTLCLLMLIGSGDEGIYRFFNIPLYMYDYFFWGGLLLILLLNVLFTLLFLNISLLSTLAGKLRGKLLEKLTSYIHILSAYTTGELLVVILLSLFRFFIFSLQFYLLLLMFSVKLPLFQGMLLIGLIFFVMTMIPTVAIAELGVRGSVSLFFIGIYFGGADAMPATVALGVVAASTALWLINLALPALAGALFVFNLKFFRKPGYEHG